MRRKIHLVLGVLAPIVSALGASTAILVDAWWSLPAGCFLHIVGAQLAVRAAMIRRPTPLTEVERDAVLCLATLAPVVGPALAWRIPRRDVAKTVENAHEVVERYMTHVKPAVPEHERTLFTGDHDRDLARKLDMESFIEVLNHGETDQKRSALFRLAELGEPHHLALVRRCLEDDDQEVRLYAYGELERLTREHETAIAEARRDEAQAPSCAEAKKALSKAHSGLAGSGVLDRPTSGFHYRAAAMYARQAQELDGDDVEAVLLEAVAQARLGDLDAARACLEGLAEEHRERTDVALAIAEVAFCMRDFGTARAAAGHLILFEEELPGWLAALCVAETPPPEEEEDDDGQGEEEEKPEGAEEEVTA
jgi:hypothetical protein